MYNSKRFNGFTLAEVLITLTIIGVVASMSIPGIVANKNKTEYVTGLKKAYATLSQVMQRITQQAGCINDLKCTGYFVGDNDPQAIGDAMVANMSVTKNCERAILATSSDEGCWPLPYTLDGTGNGIDFDRISYYKFITADGMSFVVRDDNGNCNTDDSASDTGPLFNVCGSVAVDINGKKGPNRMGRDMFFFNLTSSSRIIPFGVEDDAAYGHWKSARCGIGTDSGRGESCAARIMEEGWEMNY